MDIKFANSNWKQTGWGHSNIIFVLDEHGENPQTLVVHNSQSSIYFDVFIAGSEIPPIYIKKPKDWIFLTDEELLAHVVKELRNTENRLEIVQNAFNAMLDERLDFLSQERQV